MMHSNLTPRIEDADAREIHLQSATMHEAQRVGQHPYIRREQTIQQIHIGCVTRLRIFTVTEFGTRASFVLERRRQEPVDCCVDGQVARAFIASYREGDNVAVSGAIEPRPSTASSKTPWTPRFRVRSLRTHRRGRGRPGVVAKFSDFDVSG